LRPESSFFRLFGQLGLPPGFKVAFGAFLCFVVHVLGIRLESDFLGAAGAFDVEAVDGDGVVLFVRRLFAGVELATLVDELSAGGALLDIMLAMSVLMRVEVWETHLHRVGCHESDGLQEGPSLLGPLLPDHLGRIEIRREVFLQHLTFRHGCGCCGGGVVMRKKKEKKKVIIDAPAAFVRRVLEKAAITWSVLTSATNLRQQHLHVKDCFHTSFLS
jgi:hypothetical protein